MSKQAIAWYLVTDVASFDRTDIVDYPETLPDNTSNAPDPITAPSGIADDKEDDTWDWLYDMGGIDAFRRLARRRNRFPTREFETPFIRDPDAEEDSSTDDESPPDVRGRWLLRAGRAMWPVLGVPIINNHANTRRSHCRITVSDLFGLALRDRVDIISGDWNQSGHYLGERMYNAVKFYEQ